MSIYKLDTNSSSQEIEEFYNLYIKSFPDLCIWKGITIINLNDYLKPSKDIKIFKSDIDFLFRRLEMIIYYTHNNDVINSIALLSHDFIDNCFVKIDYLCGNQSTRHKKINGLSQGLFLLDNLFRIYNNYIILIEPATEGLIDFYTNYRKPSFSYNKNGLIETFGFLIYGNINTLNEKCFAKIFRSIGAIQHLSQVLQFKNLSDLYDKTNDLTTLKEKLITKLDFLIKTKQLEPQYYEQLIDKILSLQYYDIDDILITSNDFMRGINKKISASLYAGGKNKSNKNKSKKNKSNKNKSKKNKSKKNKSYSNKSYTINL